MRDQPIRSKSDENDCPVEPDASPAAIESPQFVGRISIDFEELSFRGKTRTRFYSVPELSIE